MQHKPGTHSVNSTPQGHAVHKGRGAVTNPHNRFAPTRIEACLPEWPGDGNELASPATELRIDHAKTIIASNRSPDVPFTRSINPYKGCEHGCVYCFARPSHAYWDCSPGLDFETKIFYKPAGPALLEETLQKPTYQCEPIAFGTNTDPYQPIDKQLGLTRELLLVLQKYRHPFTLVSKGSHILRDIDILADMAAEGLCSVMLSLTTRDNGLKRILEPRAASHEQRLKTIAALAAHQVPVGVLLAPVIPCINDNEIEALLADARSAGASSAAYVFLRLPHELKDMWQAWLTSHFPERAQHVMNVIRASRGGRINSSRFGERMRGEGVYAELIRSRFTIAARKLGLPCRQAQALNTSLFYARRQALTHAQLSLF